MLFYHRLIEAFKFAFANRNELGDEDFYNMDSVNNYYYLLFFKPN